MPVPTVNFAPEKTVLPRKSIAQFTPVVGGVDGTPVNLIGKVANYDSTIETTEREVPDASGYLRPDRIEGIRHDEFINFETEDIKVVAEIFGGLANKLVKGKVQLWVVDPEDAATKVAIKSNLFKCSAQLEGGLNLETGVVSKVTVKFTALEKVDLTVDATA